MRPDRASSAAVRLHEGLEHGQGFRADVVLDALGVAPGDRLGNAQGDEEGFHRLVAGAAGAGEGFAGVGEERAAVGLLQHLSLIHI